MKVFDWLLVHYDRRAQSLTWYPFLFGVFAYSGVVFVYLLAAGAVSGHAPSYYFSMDFLAMFATLIIPVSASVLGLSLLEGSVGVGGSRPRWFLIACCTGFSAFIGWLLGGREFMSAMIAASGGLAGMVAFLHYAVQPRWMRKYTREN